MSAPDCAYNLPPGVWCPASPFCGCQTDQPAPKPLPDPDQLDIYDALGDEP